jgi:uncharacterized repeat protein (TIGR03806 family)
MHAGKTPPDLHQPIAIKAMTQRGLTFFLVLFLLITGCSRQPPALEPQFFPKENPALLSEWQMLSVEGQSLQLADGVTPYDLNAPLFTDYALKLRTIWMPEGVQGEITGDGILDLPVGSVITKSFYYPLAEEGAFSGKVLKARYETGKLDQRLTSLETIRLVETRMLVHRQNGWEAVSYVWNDEQSDAALTRIGDAQKLTLIGEERQTEFTYIVPDINQCAACHVQNATTKILTPIGPKHHHMNKDFSYKGEATNQLVHLQNIGFLKPDNTPRPPANVDWRDETYSADKRARSYLDINCTHCHNPVGAADTSGLFLNPEIKNGPELGLCKLPIAAGAGTGGRLFDIVPGKPDQSILLYRMETTKPDAMMPELGRSLAHKEGVALIREWIEGMAGDCT